MADPIKVKWAPDYMDWVPDGHLVENLDVEYIAKALNAEFEIFKDRIWQWRGNIEPRTSNVAGIREFEDWLGLAGSSAMDFQERVDAVIAQLNKTLPYTWIRLHKMMAAIVGWGNFSLSRDKARLTVEVDQSRYSSWPVIWSLLEEVVPMNLYWVLVDKVTAEPGKVKAAVGARVNMQVDSPMPGDIIHTHEHLRVYDYGVTRIKESTGEGFKDVEPHFTHEGFYISCGSVIANCFTTGEPF